MCETRLVIFEIYSRYSQRREKCTTKNILDVDCSQKAKISKRAMSENTISNSTMCMCAGTSKEIVTSNFRIPM
uniref:Uncharacterized protein n=1 Tax=Octopus bimaculoides TaxID=37653 RepID=A0A0L8H288_OCTBM